MLRMMVNLGSTMACMHFALSGRNDNITGPLTFDFDLHEIGFLFFFNSFLYDSYSGLNISISSKR